MPYRYQIRHFLKNETKSQYCIQRHRAAERLDQVRWEGSRSKKNRGCLVKLVATLGKVLSFNSRYISVNQSKYPQVGLAGKSAEPSAFRS